MELIRTGCPPNQLVSPPPDAVSPPRLPRCAPPLCRPLVPRALRLCTHCDRTLCVSSQTKHLALSISTVEVHVGNTFARPSRLNRTGARRHKKTTRPLIPLRSALALLQVQILTMRPASARTTPPPSTTLVVGQKRQRYAETAARQAEEEAESVRAESAAAQSELRKATQSDRSRGLACHGPHCCG
jgi:hypothetical protein